MADFAIVPANVQYASASIPTGIAGEALEAGYVLALKVSDQKLYRASAGDPALRNVVGVAVGSAVAGQICPYVGSGEITLGPAVFTGPGELVVLSGTPGKMAPVGDLVATWQVILLGWSTAATKVCLNKVDTGIVLS